MLEQPQLQELARAVFGRKLPALQLDEVIAEDMIGSEGEAMVRLTMVLAAQSADAITGQDVLDMLLALHDELERSGEERFPIVEYATADDLDGDEPQDD